MVYGAPGAGKTFFAEQFSDKFRAPFIDLDSLRRQIFKPPTYLAEESQDVKKLGLSILSNMFRSHAMIVLEGGLDTKKDRRQVIKAAETAGYQPMLIWVQTDPKTTKSRARTKLTNAQFEEAVNSLEPPTAKEQPIVVSGKHTFDTQIKVILKQLYAQRSQQA
jgi:predicted kinase